MGWQCQVPGVLGLCPWHLPAAAAEELESELGAGTAVGNGKNLEKRNGAERASEG